MKNLLRVCLFVSSLMILAAATPARAVLFSITAEVDDVFDPNGVVPDVMIGDTLEVLLEYDLSLPDADGDSEFGSYSGVVPDDSLVGTTDKTLFFDSSDFLEIFVQDSPTLDRVEYFASGDTDPSLRDFAAMEGLDGFDFIDLFVLLEDPDGTALASDALPASLDLAEFETALLIFSAESTVFDPFPDFVIGFEVVAVITDIRLVPEPGSAALLWPLVLALARRRRFALTCSFVGPATQGGACLRQADPGLR